MTAKEAAAASDRVAEQARQEKEALERKKLEAKEREELYIRTTAVESALKKFHEDTLPKAIKEGTRIVIITLSWHETAVLVRDALMRDGYKVYDIQPQYHEAYEGSNDDGYAYAHDAYTDYAFSVAW